MGTDLPLSALLSQAYVAFAIEFDNEFEHMAPHRTTNYGSTAEFPTPPWLVSMAMWLRFMRYIPVEGITFSELQSRLAISNKGLNTWLARLGKWWGYLEVVDLDSSGSSKIISARASVRPTVGGRKAIGVWRTLIPVMETRWRERFGIQTLHALENELQSLAGRLDPAVPAHFPVLEYEDQKSRAARMRLPARELALPELLAKVLLAFASEFDSQSQVSLAVCANSLRVAPDSGIRVRDLPRVSGLSVDGAKTALRQLVRERLGVIRPDSSGSLKILVPTPKARLARDNYHSLAESIEKDWEKRFGEGTVNQLRIRLERIVLSREGTPSPLLGGLIPYPDGWRAHLPPLEVLPHFPMVSHRGGFPDGS